MVVVGDSDKCSRAFPPHSPKHARQAPSPIHLALPVHTCITCHLHTCHPLPPFPLPFPHPPPCRHSPACLPDLLPPPPPFCHLPYMLLPTQKPGFVVQTALQPSLPPSLPPMLVCWCVGQDGTFSLSPTHTPCLPHPLPVCIPTPSPLPLLPPLPFPSLPLFGTAHLSFACLIPHLLCEN